MSRCESSTRKKAWCNPLAPLARCSRASVMVVELPTRTGHYGQPMYVCRAHGNALLKRGWALVSEGGSR